MGDTHLPRELHPAEEDSRDVERDESGREEEERQTVLEPQAVDCAVHAAVRAAQRKPRRLHRAVDAVEHSDCASSQQETSNVRRVLHYEKGEQTRSERQLLLISKPIPAVDTQSQLAVRKSEASSGTSTWMMLL